MAGEDGFVWRSPGGALVGIGQAARVPVGTGPGRIERAAEAVAALLDAVEVDDAGGTGLGPAAVGALLLHPATPGELASRPRCCAPTPTAGPGPSSPNQPRSPHPGRPTCASGSAPAPSAPTAGRPPAAWTALADRRHAAHREGLGANGRVRAPTGGGLWTAGSPPDPPLR